MIAALAFAAIYLPTILILYGYPTVSAIPPLMLGELFILNVLVSLVAGAQNFRTGLVAAMGIHSWADIVLHVIWPLFD